MLLVTLENVFNGSCFSDNIYICIHTPNNCSKSLESRINLLSDLTTVFFKTRYSWSSGEGEWRQI